MIVTLVAASSPVAAQPTEAIWDAALGLTPDQVCPAYTLTDTAPLRGLCARKQVDATLRAELLSTIDSIHTDVGGLRNNPCD